MIRFDSAAFRAVNGLAGSHPARDAVGAFCARWLLPLTFAAVAASAVLRSGLRPAVLLDGPEWRALAAAACAFTGDWLLSFAYFRQRPYVTLSGVRRIIPEPITAHSFPSGHSSAAFAVAFVMLCAAPPFGAALFAAAALVAFGRVYAGVHYPFDVLAGAVVGFFWAAVFRFLIP